MRNRSKDKMKSIKCVFIRHGSTASNREHRYLGKTDEPLDEIGIHYIKQAVDNGIYKVALTDTLNKSEVEIYSSPLCRCIQTAKIIFPDLTPKLIDNLSEMNFGEFELKNYKELSADTRYRDIYQKWIDSGGTLAFPDGESREEFIERCVTCFEKIISAIDEEKTAVFVIHGGTIMAIMSHFCGGDYFDYQVKNGCGYSCVINIDYNNGKNIIFEDIEHIVI